MIKKENITEKMLKDRAFIIAVVSCDLIHLIKDKHEDWLDEHGYGPYYDLVIEITDYMLFDEDSYYLKFLKLKEEDENLDFYTFAQNCFDWYFMAFARQLVTNDLLHEVCFGDTKKYFAGIEKAKEAKKVKMIRQVIPPVQMEIVQRALNVYEKALQQQDLDKHDDINDELFDILCLRGMLKGEVAVVHPKEVADAFSFHYAGVDWPEYYGFPKEDI
jgi:hypothetical protein